MTLVYYTRVMSKRFQGDQGEAVASLHYIMQGYIVSVPQNEECKYDLIVDKLGTLYRVQVKTSKALTAEGNYIIGLRTNGANYTQKNKHTYLTTDVCDLLFAVVGDGRCFEIPISEISGMSAITMGKSREKYFVGKYVSLV
jgi:hypothetical protein